MIRQLDIPGEWLKSGFLGPLPNLLDRGQNPADVRTLQGTIFLAFPEVEDQAEYLFAVPGVLEWLRVLHVTIPHAGYFLTPTEAGGSLEGLLLCGSQLDFRSPLPESIPMTADLIAWLVDRMTVSAAFATDVGDDWERIVQDFVAPLGDSMSLHILKAVEAQLPA